MNVADPRTVAEAAPASRMHTPISDAELARRWTAVRREMAARDIDALVMQNADDWLGGTVKWFTDHPATNGYPRTVIFHAEGAMTVVDMGPFDGRRKLDGRDRVHRGVDEIITTPAFPSIVYSTSYQAELALDVLKRRGYRTVGLVRAGAMPHGFVEGVKQGLSGATRFVEAADFIDPIKAIKSPEEITLIRRTAEMQDAVFARVLEGIRPGMRDFEVTALAQYHGRLLGSEQGLFLGSSAPLGMRSDFVDRHMQGRVLQEGDHYSLLIENNGAGGLYAEIARTIVLGRASQEVLDGFEHVREAQDHTLKLLRPGATCADIATAHDTFMCARGLPPEHRLYCHGQGYDLVERPLVRRDETMPLAAGMCLAVHPGYETASIFAVICDNYMIEESGPSACLHRTPKKVFEL
jgi:Xaa-Pro aminopeptidase